MNKILVGFLLLVVTQSHAAAPPSQWYENDWVKFIDAAAWGSLGDAYSKVGGRFPLVDVYSALSATGSAVKPGLQLWLRRKIANAYANGEFDRGDRYNAFYACLTWNSCDELRRIEASYRDSYHNPNRSSSIMRFKPNLSRIWKSKPYQYGEIHWLKGWYGVENKTITIDNEYWDNSKGTYVIEGKWGRKNNPSHNGGFKFAFDTPCSFSGSWWYSNSKSLASWSGNCE